MNFATAEYAYKTYII